MMTRKKIYTLIVDNHDVSIISRQRLLEDILYRLNMIYEYADKLDDLTQEINLKLDKLIEKAEKRTMTHHQIMILLYSFKIVGRTAFPQFLIIQNLTTPCYFRLPKSVIIILKIECMITITCLKIN